MPKNSTKEDILKWKLLVNEFDNRTINVSKFCSNYNISKASIYGWRRYFLELEESENSEAEFINLNVPDILPDQEILKDKVENILSPFKINNKSGLVIEFISGCKLYELDAIIKVLNVTQ